MRFYIKLRFTLCFKRGCLRAPLKESAKLWPPLPLCTLHYSSLPHTALSRSELLLHCTVWNVHCCGVHCTTSWYKCSALNSGASLNRGRKFMAGISSRHESWQKIRHIPHPPFCHISTLSTCTPDLKTSLKRFPKILCAVSFGGQARDRGKDAVRLFGAVVGWLLETGPHTTLSIGHQRDISIGC